MNTDEQNIQQPFIPQFGEEMILEEAGFSFHPINGFELEVDGSVYMYSDDGNLEICMIGGELEQETSIAELNDELAADFMVNFDKFELSEAGKDLIHGFTGFLNKIRFNNAEEEGLGRALICSPHINQYFFMLVISSAEHWDHLGQQVFAALKDRIHFHPQFKPTTTLTEMDVFPDLTLETYEAISPEEELIITTERGDAFLLLAARSATAQDEISITQLIDPDGQVLYRYDSGSGEIESCFTEQPIVSTHGELCLVLPCADQQTLKLGEHRLIFSTKSGLPLQEVQIIVRQTRALNLQKIDLNLWLALENERFNQPEFMAQFEADLRHALTENLAPMNLTPGKMETFHPAPDELGSFACINLDTDLADCSYMIAESVENMRALNIGLVDRLTRGDPPMDAEVNAVSSGSPGMILSPISPHACILINYAAFVDDFSGLATAIIEQMLVFCGTAPNNRLDDHPFGLSQDGEWQLRRHPIFYSGN